LKNQEGFSYNFTSNLWECLYEWVNYVFVGTRMSSTTAKIDEKGRIIIPKNIREKAQLREGSYVTVKAKGKIIIVEPLEPVADKYYGAFKIAKWPENMDEFLVEVIKKWWTTQAT
jgi:AbrB family looped-hinge helix DNA binding protein